MSDPSLTLILETALRRVDVIPRVVSPYPLSVEVPAGQSSPIRARDDLDPYAPPLEYADGRVSWSGYPSREARDEGRVRQREQEAQEKCRRAAKRAAELEASVRLSAANEARCAHSGVTELGTFGFTGPVSRDEDRRAHGGVCVHEECCDCGAQRRRNVNQSFEEVGGLGETRAARALEAARLEAEAARIALAVVGTSMRLTRRGVHAVVSIDDDGFFCVSSDAAQPSGEEIAAAWPEGLDAAVRLRHARLAAARARGEV